MTERLAGSPARTAGRVVAVSALAGAVTDVAVHAAMGTQGLGSHLLSWLAGGAAMALVMGVTITVFAVRPLVTALRRESDAAMVREHELRDQVDRHEFEGQLARALDMADAEADVLTVTEQALRVVDPNLASELLLTHPLTRRLERVAARRGTSEIGGCEVSTPQSCPAIRGGRTLTFASSTDLDACKRLWGRADEPVAAVCIPVSVAGAPSGVLHSVTKCGSRLPQDNVARLEAVSSRVGARVGLLRALEHSQRQASTDSLTGLLNRRTVEARAREMFLRGERFSVVLADLDRFKQLNDNFGHQAGDRALQLFAEVLRASLRPHDIIARYGAEEFLIVLPLTFASAAVGAVERVRESLVLALAEGTTPGFTASFGIADSTMQSDLEEVLRLADGALFEAKRQGRDRAILANPELVESRGGALTWEAAADGDTPTA